MLKDFGLMVKVKKAKMKNLVIDEIKRSLKYLNYEFEDRDINVSVPKNKEFGDLSTNIAFLLSKKNKKNQLKFQKYKRKFKFNKSV